MRKKVALHNLGCKVNAYEIEAMQQMLEQAGYEIVPFAPGADVYVINTCTVTNIADRKSRQMLHKAKKMNPKSIVIATGCYVQTDTQKLKEDAGVDLILGNNKKKEIVEVLQSYEKEHTSQEHVININQTKEYEELKITRTAENVRAYIKVQDGCNQFCSYCIIPFARGRVRSRRPRQVLEEVQGLALQGYKEVVLTGIHLSSYGIDFKDESVGLLDLIREVQQVPGIERIRLGSLEPRIITEEFAKEISGFSKICPHFHLSLQSGCDETLKRMNRRYDVEEYREKCRVLRKYFDNPALTTDVIVGFPQETEEEFHQSYEFVKSINFYETHIFKYSRRQGTKAAEMENQIQESIKGKRSDVMLKLHEEHAQAFEESHIGTRAELLLEEEILIEGVPYLVGHTRKYIKAAVRKSEGVKVNQLINVELKGFLDKHLMYAQA